ncbi:hypothetical protein OE88DRAFT_1737699 [Heliocybe sulcata]|uniref:Uncharacterized protein n=1 Tax=Heliocybe sulcata TaxID=5364 RepID=A0A5C3MSU1_9AGAM|nr:hypothetical protein OE88DRAFT_1737699 [Heliocybe sulcata]
MSPHFCCCLPIRLGAFLISFIQFGLNGIIAALIWIAVAGNRDHHFLDTKDMYRDTIVQGVLFSLMAAVALGAFIGSIRNRSGWMVPYSIITGVLLVARTVVAVLNIITIAREPDSELISQCVNDQPNNQQNTDFCHKNYKWIKALAIIIFIVPLLVETYALWIIHQYGEKLEDKEEEAGWSKSQAYSMSTGPYATVGRGSQEGLTNAPYNYPYSDGAHSFGNKPDA